MLVLYPFARRATVHPRPAPAAVAATPTPAPSATGPTAGEAKATPAYNYPRLQIPAIGVDAFVEEVGLDANGAMDVPKGNGNVAWYKNGVPIGRPGDAVVAGHLDTVYGPSVFWRLSELSPGAEVFYVKADGTKLRFLVAKSQSVPYNATVDGLFVGTGPARVSLITCGGDWDYAHNTYAKRLIVDARLA